MLEKEMESDISYIDLATCKLPLFDGTETECTDISKVKEMISQSETLIICTPEYHNSLSSSLKNLTEYLNKTHFMNKPTLIMSVAGGERTGFNALNNLRIILRSLNALVLPNQHIIYPSYFINGKVDSEILDSIYENINRLNIYKNINKTYEKENQFE